MTSNERIERIEQHAALRGCKLIGLGEHRGRRYYMFNDSPDQTGTTFTVYADESFDAKLAAVRLRFCA